MDDTPEQQDQPGTGKKPGAVERVIHGLVQLATLPTRPVQKLAEAVGYFVDVAWDLEGQSIRNRGLAEADVMVAKADAEEAIKLGRLKGEREGALYKIDTEKILKGRAPRARRRMDAQEERRQENIEAVVGHAVNALPPADKVNNEPVHPDWIARLINGCQDVADELMRQVWGRILASEVAKPGNFSPRTLAVVGTMTKADAELFAKLCAFVWDCTDDGRPKIILPGVDVVLVVGAPPHRRLGPTFDELSHLESLGLVRYEGKADLVLQFEPEAGGVCRLLYHGFVVEKPQDAAIAFVVGPAKLTAVGEELYRIADAVPDRIYCTWVEVFLRNHGFRVTSSSSDLLWHGVAQ